MQQQKKPCFKCITKNYPRGCSVNNPCDDCIPEHLKKQQQEEKERILKQIKQVWKKTKK